MYPSLDSAISFLVKLNRKIVNNAAGKSLEVGRIPGPRRLVAILPVPYDFLDSSGSGVNYYDKIGPLRAPI